MHQVHQFSDMWQQISMHVICVTGAIHPDNDANHRLYGKPVTAADILGGKVRPPPQFESLIAELRNIDAAAALLDKDNMTTTP